MLKIIKRTSSTRWYFESGVWKYHAWLVWPGPISFRASQIFLFTCPGTSYYLLVLGQVKVKLQFCISYLVIIINSQKCGSWSAGFWRSQLIWIYTVFNSFCLDSYFFKGVYTCLLFEHSEGFAQILTNYLFFNMGQVKLSMDIYPMAIYLSLGRCKLLLFPHLW